MIDLESGEQIVFEIRRHWYIFVAETIFLVFMLLAPVGILSLLEAFGESLTSEWGGLLLFLSAGWTLIIWLSFFVIWMNYHLDVWILTDRRVIDIEQHGLFSRDVSEFRLDRIQDVTIEVKGLLPTLLHFGDIHVQTAGESREFVILHVPDPYEVKKRIVHAHNEAVSNGNMRGDGH